MSVPYPSYLTLGRSIPANMSDIAQNERCSTNNDVRDDDKRQLVATRLRA